MKVELVKKGGREGAHHIAIKTKNWINEGQKTLSQAIGHALDAQDQPGHNVFTSVRGLMNCFAMVNELPQG